MIVGGGVAGLEVLLAVRALLGQLVEVVLVSPGRQFVYAPMTVAEPFGAGGAYSLELAQIAREQGAELRCDALEEVDPVRRVIRLSSGDELGYDALVVTVGGRRRAWLDGAVPFRGRADVGVLRRLLDDLDAGEVSRIAFVSPPGESWSLPLYELALLTAAHVADEGIGEVELSLVTAEESPLGLFGEVASQAVRQLLADRGIRLRAGTTAVGLDADAGRLRVTPGDSLPVDRAVAIARLEGPRIPGLPHDPDGFLPIDAHGRVRGLEAVYAAGDGTSFPVKQGGIATQQADAAADTLAAGFGAAVEPEPFRPVLRGMLLTGLGPVYLRSDISGRAGDNSEFATDTLWWPPMKIAGRHLAPYLARAGHPLPDAAPSPLVDRGPSGRPAASVAVERLAARDLALALADAESEWGHHREALSALEAAEAIDPILPDEYVTKRARWQEAARRGG